jgi:hypothetical protein
MGGETTEALVPTVREGGILVTIAAAPPEDAARERGVRAELHVTSPSSDQLAGLPSRESHMAKLRNSPLRASSRRRKKDARCRSARPN